MMLASTILIADDHPLFRTALKQAVGQCLPNVTMLEANSVDELFSVVESTPELEIMFLDLHMLRE
ncbi:hypothetical protein [Psychrosphaera algicola]|uniref:hypothetical protein n=1 Tax=Psychrosphaera algicola TaxID=3023714 RepID=UPI002FEE3CBB